MNVRKPLLPMFVVLLLVGPGADAQEPAAATPAATHAPTGAAAAGDKKVEPVPDPASPAKPAAARGSPQRFEPSERVRPDFDVAFPVDI